MSRMRIAVVTGGAGFIGSHMVDLLLDNGFRVVAVDDLSTGRWKNIAHRQEDPNLRFEWRDLRTVAAGDPIFKDAEYVFHFAGRGDIVPSIEQPSEYLSVNVMATVAALEAARAAGVKKFVYAASSSCYGFAAVPTPETAPIEPQHPYALSKRLGEEAVLHWGRVYRLPVQSLRIFNAFGPRARTTGAYGAVFGVFLAQKLAGKPFTVVGDGTQRRDFVYVTDVARAFLLAAESEQTNAVYNLGTGSPRSINEVVQLLGGDVTHIPKRPGEPDCTWAVADKLRKELGWAPQVSFEQGVAKLLESIEDYRSAPLWEPESIRSATNTWFSALAG